MKMMSLADVASAAIAGEPYGPHLANFVDEFYANPNVEAIAQRPPLMRDHVEDGTVRDSYLAAVAEELARKYGLPNPGWIFDEDRKLATPWFASPLRSLRAVLFEESPIGFRSRNLFVSANALSRA
jgi:hypothetical protein